MIDSDIGIYAKLRIQNATLAIRVDYLTEVCNVTNIIPMINGGAEVAGCINLRGHLIPIVYLEKVWKISKRKNPPPFAAVLKYKDSILAIGIDENIGVSRIDRKIIQVFEQKFDKEAALSMISPKNNLSFSLLDVPKIFDSPNLTTAKYKTNAFNQGPNQSEKTERFLIFRTGDVTFSVAAKNVCGTVPRTAIQPNALTSDICLGSLNYRKRKVSVVCAANMLGATRPHERVGSEVIVLQSRNDQLLGIAADSILYLQNISLDKFSPTPGIISLKFPFLDKTSTTCDEKLIYNLDASTIWNNKKIKALAGISKNIPEEVQRTDRGPSPQKRVKSDRRKYLVYRCITEVATPIEQIKSIHERPREILPVSSSDPRLFGIFSLRGHPTPLFDLRKIIHNSCDEIHDYKILFVCLRGEQIGFAVDEIRGIYEGTDICTAMKSGVQNGLVRLMMVGKEKLHQSVNLSMIAL